MGNKYESRVKKLEKFIQMDDNPITKIVVRFINVDGSVSSTMVKTLINDVWDKQTR